MQMGIDRSEPDVSPSIFMCVYSASIWAPLRPLPIGVRLGCLSARVSWFGDFIYKQTDLPAKDQMVSASRTVMHRHVSSAKDLGVAAKGVHPMPHHFHVSTP